MASLSPLSPRNFPSSGFVELDPKQRIEEEEIPHYSSDDYYPVYIGEVFQSRYQVVSKLGFGISSTVWLCRDLRERSYVTLKVCVAGRKDEYEVKVSNLLENSSIDHPGKKLIRLVLDSFEATGPQGSHRCLVYRALGMNYTQFLNLLPDSKLPNDLLQRSVQLLLVTLDFLHQCHVIHTDVSPNNLLQGIEDPSILSEMEEGEINRPIARKILPDRHIYSSRPMPINTGLPVLCDLGEARVGDHKHKGDIMPGIYRAPEVILGIEWDSKVDIWSVGVMVWDLLQRGRLFFAKKDGILNDEQHLAELTSLLGPPPLEFLRRSEKCKWYWDEKGNWKGSIPIPDQSFKMRERTLSSEDRGLFINFMQRTLRWLPEERPAASDLASDEFLMQAILTAQAPKE